MTRIIKSENAPAAIGPYSQGIKAGDYYFLSGQIPLNPVSMILVSEDIEDQTHQVFQNIQAVLSSENLTLKSVVKATIFLDNINDFAKVNEIYEYYFREWKPARSCVEVSKLPRNSKIEIEVIAYKK